MLAEVPMFLGMRHKGFLFFLAIVASPLSASANRGFEDHLLEAIEINKQRMPLYSKLTDGRSESVSGKLIKMEKALLPIARVMDQRSQFYRQYGVPVLLDEFVSMDQIPKIQESPGPVQELPTVRLNEYSGWKLMGHFLSQRSRTLQEVVYLAEEELKILEETPSFFCMTRHILESIRRVAYFGMVHEQEAAKNKVSSPERITRKVLLLHYFGLPIAVQLDRNAAPIQVQGVSIICNDVPKIDLNR